MLMFMLWLHEGFGFRQQNEVDEVCSDVEQSFWNRDLAVLVGVAQSMGMASSLPGPLFSLWRLIGGCAIVSAG